MEMGDVHLISSKHGVGIAPLMRKVTKGIAPLCVGILVHFVEQTGLGLGLNRRES